MPGGVTVYGSWQALGPVNVWLHRPFDLFYRQSTDVPGCMVRAEEMGGMHGDKLCRMSFRRTGRLAKLSLQSLVEAGDTL